LKIFYRIRIRMSPIGHLSKTILLVKVVCLHESVCLSDYY
jgi:hypothetical protein